MPRRTSDYKIVQSSTLYRGRVIRLVKDRFILRAQGPQVFTRELIVHPGAVAIVPFAGKDRIILLRQFRYAAKGELWEIPAGTRNCNEEELACAKRELEEETGFRARRWELLTRFYPAPGVSNEIITLFKAADLFPGVKNLDPDEWIKSRTVSVAQAIRMLRKGSIRDGKTIAGILWVRTFATC